MIKNKARKMLAATVLIVAVFFPMATYATSSAADAHSRGHNTCITSWKEGWWNVKLKARNDCGHTINMKYQITFGSDSACYQVRPGGTLTHDPGSWGSARGKGVAC